jgi:hypothetical protein
MRADLQPAPTLALRVSLVPPRQLEYAEEQSDRIPVLKRKIVRIEKKEHGRSKI